MTESTYSDACPATRHFRTGRSDGPWYTTLMPFEHFDSGRSQRFPHSCDVAQLTHSGTAAVSVRSAPGNYPSPYNLVTRERNELFIYGGYINQAPGAYVAKLDPATLEELWRVNWYIDDPLFFDWPGVASVHGNGFVYAVAGNILARIDPETGDNRTITLPEHPDGGGAAYNGFVISSKGFLIAKSLERGGTELNSLPGLREVAAKGPPAILVAVDPASLKIVARIEAPGPVLGRVTTATHDGEEYVYLPGLTQLWRYRFTGTEFIQDKEWSPVYAPSGEEPGTACGLLGDWVVIQTNFLRSHQPLRISAFHVQDCRRSHTFQPFPDSRHSQEFSKPALDTVTMRVYTNDQAARRVAALSLDPVTGFSLIWEKEQIMASFWAIVGPEKGRNLIGTDFTAEGDHVLWRDAESGEELARSGTVDSKFNGNIVSTGFDGCFYYLGVNSETINELRLTPGDVTPPQG